MIPGGKTPILPATELQSMGFAAVAAELLRTGMTAPSHDRMIAFEEFNDLVGLRGFGKPRSDTIRISMKCI